MPGARELREEAIDRLETEYGFSGGEFYLLETIPLIAMMWMDGRNQAAEMRLLYKYVLNHVATLSGFADGEEVVSVDEVNRFLERFAHEAPSADLLKVLRQLATSVMEGDDEWCLNTESRQTVLDYCLDIAAAAVHHYPYADHERLMDAEKALLHDLMHAFAIADSRAA